MQFFIISFVLYCSKGILWVFNHYYKFNCNLFLFRCNCVIILTDDNQIFRYHATHIWEKFIANENRYLCLIGPAAILEKSLSRWFSCCAELFIVTPFIMYCLHPYSSTGPFVAHCTIFSTPKFYNL